MLVYNDQGQQHNSVHSEHSWSPMFSCRGRARATFQVQPKWLSMQKSPNSAEVTGHAQSLKFKGSCWACTNPQVHEQCQGIHISPCSAAVAESARSHKFCSKIWSPHFLPMPINGSLILQFPRVKKQGHFPCFVFLKIFPHLITYHHKWLSDWFKPKLYFSFRLR